MKIIQWSTLHVELWKWNWKTIFSVWIHDHYIQNSIHIKIKIGGIPEFSLQATCTFQNINKLEPWIYLFYYLSCIFCKIDIRWREEGNLQHPIYPLEIPFPGLVNFQCFNFSNINVKSLKLSFNNLIREPVKKKRKKNVENSTLGLTPPLWPKVWKILKKNN